jgi:nicotinamidase-related amidase
MPWRSPPSEVAIYVTMPKPQRFALELRKTALIIVDMQELSRSSVRVRNIIDGNVILLEKFRQVGAPVIFMKSVRTPAALEVTRFGLPLWRPEGSAEVEILHELAPQESESIVTKYSHDPFANTELDLLLQRKGVRAEDWTVLVTGYSAAGCAHAGIMGFSNRHYMTIVPMDCIAANSWEEEARVYHQFLGRGYSYNIGFTTSSMVAFKHDAGPPEKQLVRSVADSA